MKLAETSRNEPWDLLGPADGILGNLPLQEASQTSQIKRAFVSPELLSRRLPQSVQKTREPMADMLNQGVSESNDKSWVHGV